MARNSLYSVFGFAAPLLASLALTPILVRSLGEQDYGLWTFAVALVTFSAALGAGLGTATTKYVAHYRGTNQIDGFSAIGTASFILHVLVAGLITLALQYASQEIVKMVAGSVNSTSRLDSIVHLASFGVFASIMRGVGVAVSMGLERYDIAALLTALPNAFIWIVATFVAVRGGPVEDAVGSAVVVLWVAAALAVGLTVRIFHGFGGRLVFSRRYGIELSSFAAQSGVAGLGTQVFNSADRFVVAAALGFSALTYYSVSVSLASGILQITGLLSQILLPTSSALHATAQNRLLWKYFWTSTFALASISAVGAVLLLVFSEPLLTLWMGPRFSEHTLSALRILIVIYAAIAVGAPSYHITLGIGSPSVAAGAVLAGGIATVALIYILSSPLGLNGAALGNSGYLVSHMTMLFLFMRLRPSWGLASRPDIPQGTSS